MYMYVSLTDLKNKSLSLPHIKTDVKLSYMHTLLLPNVIILGNSSWYTDPICKTNQVNTYWDFLWDFQISRVTL